MTTVPDKPENKPSTSPKAKLSRYSHAQVIIGFVAGAVALLLIGFIGGKTYAEEHIEHFLGWQENYEQNFFADHDINLPHFRLPSPPPNNRPFIKAHSALGKILSISGMTLTVQDKDGTEESIVMDTNTVIRLNNQTLKPTDLKADQQVAVFGNPNNQGQIQAEFIRVFP